MSINLIISRVLKWKNSIDEITKFPDSSDLPMIIIENKCDLVDNLNETEPQFEEFYVKNKFINGFRTSSKNSININESMDFLIKNIIDRLEKMYSVNSSSGNKVPTQESENKSKNIVLDKKNNSAKKEKAKCC
jgi:GTPase SAR1 family protein